MLAASGFGAYCFYIYGLTGNPFEWASTLQRWGYHPGGAPWAAPLRLVQRLVTHPYAYLASDPMAPYDTLYGVTGIVIAAWSFMNPRSQLDGRSIFSSRYSAAPVARTVKPSGSRLKRVGR